MHRPFFVRKVIISASEIVRMACVGQNREIQGQEIHLNRFING